MNEAERWREATALDWTEHPEAVEMAGDALAAALEAERERVRRMGEDHAEYRKNAAAALEARDRRIAELEAGLRRIEWMPAYASWGGVIQTARDLLAKSQGGGGGGVSVPRKMGSEPMRDYPKAPPTPPRPEVVASHPAITEWREVRDPESFSGFVHMREKGDALAKALEDTAAERDRAHADLRRIAGTNVDVWEDPKVCAKAQVLIARRRLENP